MAPNIRGWPGAMTEFLLMLAALVATYLRATHRPARPRPAVAQHRRPR